MAFPGSHNISDILGDGDFPTTWKGLFIPGHGYMLAWGATVPADAATGYGKGCIFLHTDLTGETDAVYSNIGSTTSANFNAVTVAAD